MIKQPVGIVKLTNVAVIKYKVKGKTFEIACYKNKVIDWRNGIENNISEVLQIEEIFSDAQKGKKVKKSQIEKHFPKQTKTQIIQEILDKGQMQVSGLERDAMQEDNEKKIIEIITKKIIHPKSKKRFSKETIQKALKEIHLNIQYNKDPKKQAMNAIQQLEQYYIIQRTGKLLKIKTENQDLIKQLKKDLQYETIQQLEDNFESILIKPEYSHIIYQYQDELQPTLIDNAYYNQSTQNINENIEIALERTNIPLPFQSIKHTRREFQENDKKEVIGFNQVTFQTPVSQGEKSCSTCQGNKFPDLALYKEHLKSDWHKSNLKRKMKGEPPLSKDDFINNALLETMI